MLSVRRLSPGGAIALGLRIHTTLPAAYGRDGSVMAAILIARCRQALAEPEVWPSLLDDEELKTAYAAYRQTQSLFTGGGAAFGGAAAAPGFAEKNLNSNKNLPEWFRGLTRALTLFKDKILHNVPPGLPRIEIPSAVFNQGKPFKTGGPQLLAAYIGWILGSGALQGKSRADAYADEMRRRGIAVPS